MAEQNLPVPGESPGGKFTGVNAPGGKFTGRVVFGTVVMVLGILWTLQNLGFIADAGAILRWWPIVLVLAGLWRLFGVGGMPRRVSGALFTLVGLLLLADRLDYFDFDLWDLWPLALIAIGFGLVTRHWWARGDGAAVPGNDPDDQIEAFAFWSGVDRKPSSAAFRGGDITAVMGGVDIDLRSATPVAGGAVLDLFVWMGGVELFVPKDWRVVNEGTAIMGAFEDGRQAPRQDATKTLRLRGFVLMGGVEIKN